MVLENRNSQTSAELLAEKTGRDSEEFTLSEETEIPDLEDLTEVSAEEFYDD